MYLYRRRDLSKGGIPLMCVVFYLLAFNAPVAGQGCIELASPEIAGYCDDIFYPCNQKNFFETPDLLTDKYDYTITRVANFYNAQKFGKIGNTVQDKIKLGAKIFIPENNMNSRPVILYSPLSSFSNSNIDGPLSNYICAYFAKKGYTVIAFESRRFSIKRSTMTASTTLPDYIDNPYYLSDTAILNDFIDFRENGTGDYGFFDLMHSMSMAEDGKQIAHDAYLEMLYKTTYDVKYLLELIKIYRNIYGFDINNTFIMGGSAGAAQALHAAYLNHPDDFDYVFDSILMQYKGMNYPNEGNLSDDFNQEPDLNYNIFPNAVINLWGIITSLNIINEGDPSIYSVHGTWDDVFPFQIRKDEALGMDVGFGSEGIFCKAKEMGLHSDIYIVCKGKHSLYPVVSGTSCYFPDEYQKILFDEILQNISVFLIEEVGGFPTTNDIITKNSPRYYANNPPATKLAPPANNLLLDSNEHCPLIYPQQFNVNLFLNHPNNNKITGNDNPTQNKPDAEVAAGKLKVIPNPFSSKVKIVFDLQKSGIVSLVIYNANGSLIHQAIQGVEFETGRYQLSIDTDMFHNGTYTVSLLLEGRIISEKMVKL